MTYQPFTLKYRPQTFADVVGQAPVATTLRNALRDGRVANAYLFTGSRGVGKTSMARILAKALNCPHSVDAEPCNACEICQSISVGEDIDVMEIDGASNRGVDEIRSIRDNVGYLPARARLKIYIIDEVHMLTIQAFNALLKTLEEPPPHVKFIFATTEFQDVPETIVSRCQRFDFRRITLDDLVDRLRHICEREGLSAEPGVLEEIARKAEGGLRDSVGLLDQVVSFAGNQLTAGDVERALGSVDVERLRDLLIAAGEGDVAAVLRALDDSFETGRDAEDLLKQVLEILREAMSGTARNQPSAAGGRRAPLIEEVRTRFDLDRLLFSLRLLLNTWREIKQIGQGRLQLEIAFLKLARSVDLIPWGDVVARLERGEFGGASAVAPPATAGAGRPAPAPAPGSGFAPRPAAAAPPAAPPARTLFAPRPPAGSAPQASAPAGAPAPAAEPETHLPPLEVVRAQWPKVLQAFQSQNARLAAMVEHLDAVRVQGTSLQLAIPANRTLVKQSLEIPANREVLEKIIGSVLGTTPRVRFELSAAQAQSAPAPGARKDVYGDPGIRKVVDALNGGIIHVDPSKT